MLEKTMYIITSALFGGVLSLAAILSVGPMSQNVEIEIPEEPVAIGEPLVLLAEEERLLSDLGTQTKPLVLTPGLARKPAVKVEVEEDPVEVIEVEEEVPVEEVVTPDPEEVELLAKVIYQEAGGDACCDECRRRVADVVLNRVADERFPNTILEVLTQERQYGRYHWTGVIWPERASNPGEAEAVERARRIATEVLSGQHSDLYGEGYIWQAEFTQGRDVIYCEQCATYFGR